MCYLSPSLIYTVYMCYMIVLSDPEVAYLSPGLWDHCCYLYSLIKAMFTLKQTLMKEQAMQGDRQNVLDSVTGVGKSYEVCNCDCFIFKVILIAVLP